MGIGFIDAEVYLHSARSLRGFILTADVSKSVQLLRYQVTGRRREGREIERGREGEGRREREGGREGVLDCVVRMGTGSCTRIKINESFRRCMKQMRSPSV